MKDGDLKKVYYAHHSWKYKTPIEAYEIELLRSAFRTDSYRIINPREFVDQSSPESEIMKQCYDLINECDCLVFSTVSNMIGQGVFNELAYAMNKRLPIYRINGVDVYQETFDGFYDDFQSRALFNIVDDIVFSGNPRIYATVKPLIMED